MSSERLNANTHGALLGELRQHGVAFGFAHAEVTVEIVVYECWYVREGIQTSPLE